MSEWWFVLLLLAIVVAAAFLYVRSRNTRIGGGSATDDSSRNYRDERETTRLGGMSDEDREWEAASQERNRQTEGRGDTPPGSV